MVEFVNYRKSYSSIQNPVFNLLDPTSLLTWLDLRTILRDAGKQYKLRMQIFVGSFAFVLIAFWGLIIGRLFGFIKLSLRPDEWFYASFLMIYLIIPFAKLLGPIAYLNEETGKQVKKFNDIRLFLSRL